MALRSLGLVHDGLMPVLDAAPSRLLIVEDDPTVAEVLTRFLRHDGYEVEVAADGISGLDRACSGSHDLVVLDLMLPRMAGLEVCRRLRERVAVPVIMLTALGQEADRIVGLDLGADDYLAKPFSARELTARIRAVLRRANGLVPPASVAEVLRAGDVEVDTGAREVRIGGQVVSLTVKEFDLLAYMVRCPRQAFRREELLEAVWGFSYGDPSTVTVHVRRLREKVEVDPSDPRRVCTVWGVGYRFEP
jgi:DNA-binding response OmpR family regulator